MRDVGRGVQPVSLCLRFESTSSYPNAVSDKRQRKTRRLLEKTVRLRMLPG